MIGLLLLGLVLVGFVQAWRKPEWIAPYFAFVLYLRLSDALRGEFGLPSLFMFLGPALLAIPIWRWLVSGTRPGRGWQTAAWMLLVYGGVCVGSLIFAAEAERTTSALMNFADGILIILVVTTALRRFEDFDRTLWAIVFAGAILATLAVHQQLTNSYDATYAGFARAELRNIHDDTAGFRSEGPVSANYFGLLLVAVVPLATHRMLFERLRSRRVVAAVALAAVLLATYFTYSRGAIVALGAAGVFMAIAWVPRRRIGRVVLATAVPLVIAGAIILPTQYGQRLLALGQVAGIAQGETPQDGALRGRLSELQSALRMFGDHPVFGVGYGNFELHYPRYAADIGLDARREEREAHSLYLEVAAETGLVGLLSFGSLIGVALSRVFRARAALQDEGDAAAARLITAFAIALLAYLTGSLFLHLTYPRYFWLLLGIAFGTAQLVAPAPARVREEAESPALVAEGA